MNSNFRYIHTQHATVINLDNNYDKDISFICGHDYHDQPNLNFRCKYLEKEENIESAINVLDYLFRIFNSSYYLLNFSVEYFTNQYDLDASYYRNPFLGLRLDLFYDTQKDEYWTMDPYNMLEVKLQRPKYDTSSPFSCKKSTEKYQKNIFSYGLYMSQYSEIFESILLFLGEDQNYTTLSSILDSIKTHIHNNDIKLNEFYIDCGYNESDIKKFSRTCNNYSIVGIAGRHGVKSMKKLDDTDKLPLEKAKMMIHKMASHLFNKYRCLQIKSK